MVSGLIQRKKVVLEKKYGNLKLREFEGVEKCEGSVLIPGFPSVTVTPVLTVGFLVEQLKLPLVGVISSSELPPKCIIDGSQPTHTIRILGDERCTVISSESKIPGALSVDLVSCILDFSRRRSIRLVLSVEGLPTESIEQIPQKYNQLQYLSTSEVFNSTMGEANFTPVNEGVIAGITGLLLAEASIESIDNDQEVTPTTTTSDNNNTTTNATTNKQVEVGVLLAPCSATYPDARSVVSIVRVVNWLLPRNSQVDLTSLMLRADKLEKGVADFVAHEQYSKNSNFDGIYC